MSRTFSTPRYWFDVVLFLLILGMVLVFRYLVLVRFGFVYTDSDQSIMWYALKKYSQGIFHEPRFFGQAYNTMLEALFAVPFFLLGMPPQKALHKAMAIMAIPVLVILVLGFTKVHEGTSSIFFSRSRMFLAIPLLLAFSLTFIRIEVKRWFYLFFVIPFLLTGYQITLLNESIAGNLSPLKNHFIGVLPVDVLIHECAKLQELTARHHVALVLIMNHGLYDFYDFGCPACMDEFPNTLRPVYERRTWRLLEDESTVYPTILAIEDTRNLAGEYSFVTALPGLPGFYLIENNRLPTMELLRVLNTPVRTY